MQANVPFSLCVDDVQRTINGLREGKSSQLYQKWETILVRNSDSANNLERYVRRRADNPFIRNVGEDGYC